MPNSLLTGKRRWWRAQGRPPSWPLLLLLALALGGLLGWLWPHNPVAWNMASRAFPRDNLQVVLVDLDQASLTDYGPLDTWTPELYEQAVGQLQQAGTRAIGLDVVFDPARPGAAQLHEVIRDSGVVQAVQPDDPLLAADQRGGGYGISAVTPSRLGEPYTFQTGYRSADGEVLPSLAWELAQAAGAQVPLSTEPRFLYRFQPSVIETRLSFRDVAAGRFRYADVQEKVVLIGQASPDPERPTGSELQARAVASLLVPPYTSFPVWAVALAAALFAGLSVVLGRSWGLLIAVLMPFFLVLLWQAHVVFPALTFSLAGLLGQFLVGVEYLISRRSSRGEHATHLPLGTRAALTRTIETFNSPASGATQPCLILLRLDGYREIKQRYGRIWADEALDQGVRKLHELGTLAPHLDGFGFRWDPEELVFIIEPVQSDHEAREIADYMAYTLKDLTLRGVSLHPQAGYAWIRNADAGLPAQQDRSATELIMAARETLRPVPANFPVVSDADAAQPPS